MMRWTKGSFTTRASHGPIHRHGYMCGAFGIALSQGDWLIFHLPTGMMFTYSEWSTLRECKLFATALLGKGEWNDSRLDDHPEVLNQTCKDLAREMGHTERKVYAIA